MIKLFKILTTVVCDSKMASPFNSRYSLSDLSREKLARKATELPITPVNWHRLHTWLYDFELEKNIPIHLSAINQFIYYRFENIKLQIYIKLSQICIYLIDFMSKIIVNLSEVSYLYNVIFHVNIIYPECLI